MVVSNAYRKITKVVNIGGLKIGGGNPVLIQSMCNLSTVRVKEVLAQIILLAENGCEIVRVAVPDNAAADALSLIVKGSPIPVIADIHFNADLAVQAIKAGIAKVRINPGNISSVTKVRKLAACAKDAGIPIRVGANAGSLPKKLLEKYQGPSAMAMAEACLAQVAILESLGFSDIVLSVKASEIAMTIAANRIISQKVDYPIHLGITEAGTLHSGMIKSSIGIGALLQEGIGDTIRVSLSADPVHEVYTGWEILKHLEIRQRGLQLISCPGCSRCQLDVYSLAREIEKRFYNVRGLDGVKIAVMGCAVNGPGEAREAAIGVAGMQGGAVLFRNGEIIRKIKQGEGLAALCDEINQLLICNKENDLFEME